MKEVVHEIFSLEFTQAVIFFVLGIFNLILPTLMIAYAAPLPTDIEVILFYCGFILMGFAVLTFLRLMFVVAYLRSRKRFEEIYKKFEVYEKTKHICPACGNEYRYADGQGEIPPAK